MKVVNPDTLDTIDAATEIIKTNKKYDEKNCFYNFCFVIIFLF
jgi:hypothetical protein